MLKAILLPIVIITIPATLFAISGWLSGRNEQSHGCGNGSCAGCQFNPENKEECPHNMDIHNH